MGNVDPGQLNTYGAYGGSCQLLRLITTSQMLSSREWAAPDLKNRDCSVEP